MCGIAGCVSGSTDPMLDKLHHRGPDFYYSAWDSSVKMAHTRLSILDLSENGNQPMQTARYMLTYNGEIYNYQELKSYLSHDDDLATDNSDNDAKTLLNYIEKFGIAKALNDSNGMFAFGLYDKREQVIHLCVDRFAQKPLYYFANGEQFAFASSPAALLHLKDKWGINRTALQSFWKLGSVMSDCVFEGIKKVNASEHVTYNLKTGKISTIRYWLPSYQENTSGIEDLIIDSIRKVKISDVPIYIFLSGGIDSTLVASQFKGGNAIHMLSPELCYAEKVAKSFNIDLHVVTPAECDPCKAMDDYVIKSGEPTMAGITPWIVAQEAAKFCKVAITANGADELFFGYDRTTDEISKSQMDHIFRSGVDYSVRIPEIDPQLSAGRWLELMTYVQHDLNKTLDFASMAHSLEVRSPFLDHRLVEMALSIPGKQVGRKAILKSMLTKMGFDVVFLNRAKMGFSLYTPVPGLEELQKQAYQWAIDQRWLKVNGSVGRRDYLYLSASAFGFKRWFENYKSILE